MNSQPSRRVVLTGLVVAAAAAGVIGAGGTAHASSKPHGKYIPGHTYACKGKVVGSDRPTVSVRRLQFGDFEAVVKKPKSKRWVETFRGSANNFASGVYVGKRIGVYRFQGVTDTGARTGPVVKFKVSKAMLKRPSIMIKNACGPL